VARPGVRQQILMHLVFQKLSEALYERFASQPRRMPPSTSLPSAISA
jgi:hypothetical protein